MTKILRPAVFAVIITAAALPRDTAFSAQPDARQEKESYDFANGLLSRGMYDMAAEAYGEFISKYPSSRYSEEARYRLAESYFLMRENGKAAEKFESLLEGEPSAGVAADARLRLGQIRFSMGEMEQAERYFKEAMDTEGVSAETAETAEYYLADILLKSGKKKEAREAFEDFLERYPQGGYRDFAGLALGDILSEEKEFSEAAEVYTETSSAAETPEAAMEAALRAAEAFSLSGSAQRAIEKYREVLGAAASGDFVDRASIGIVAVLSREGRDGDVINEGKILLAGMENEEAKFRVKFLMANSCLNEEIFDEAGKLYGEIIAGARDKRIERRARVNNCWTLYKTGEYEKCLAETEKYLEEEKEQDVDEAVYMKGKVLGAKGDWDEAIKVYAEILKKYPDTLFRREVLYDKGWAHYQKGETSQGAEEHKKFVEEFPEDERSPGVLLKVGQEALKGGKYDEAADVYERFLNEYEKDPQRQFAIYQKARALYEQGRYDEAIATYDTLLEEFPFSEITGNVFYWRAISYQKKQDWDRAILDFREAANKGGELAVKASEAVAFSLFQKGEEEAAAEAYYAVISESIGTHAGIKKEVYMWTAEYYTEKKENEKALEVLRAMAKIYPAESDPDVLYLMGENLRNTGESEEAVKYFTMAIDKGAVSPRKERCYLGMGRTYARSGDREKAIEFLGKALSGDRDNVTGALARMEMGDLYAGEKDFSEAARQYAMVGILYDDAETVPSALFKAGESYMKSGQEKEAEKLFKELVKRYPSHPLSEKAEKEIAGINGSKTQ